VYPFSRFIGKIAADLKEDLMIWIGLTGGLATGKSTVAEILRKKSIPVIDADRIAHSVLETNSEVKKQIRHIFGDQVFDASGFVQRSTLAKLVFGRPDLLLKLESLVHPEVQKIVAMEKQKYLEQAQPFCFYDVPLLFEKNLQQQFDKVVCVVCSLQQQRERMKSRNRWSDQEIDQRLQAQLPLEEKEKKSDYVIHNSGSLQDLDQQVKKMLDSFQ
jgi:dephospho-CoA kinase